MHVAQGVVDVLEHADRVGDHDVIERTFDRGQRFRLFHVTQHELQIRMGCPGLGDGRLAEIDADAVGGLQRRKQVAATAAQFQHPLSRRHQEPHKLLIFLIICRIDAAPFLLLVDMRLDVLQQLPLAPIVGQRVNGMDGLLQRH